MRGQAEDQAPWFHVFSVEDRIRKEHPLGKIKRRVDGILEGWSRQFAQAYRRWPAWRSSPNAHVANSSVTHCCILPPHE